VTEVLLRGKMRMKTAESEEITITTIIKNIFRKTG
jgi:hypothetical protein